MMNYLSKRDTGVTLDCPYRPIAQERAVKTEGTTMDKQQNHDDPDFGFTAENLEEFRRTAEAELGIPLFCPVCETVHPFALCPLGDWSDLRTDDD
jgi:hypothetical protein